MAPIVPFAVVLVAAVVATVTDLWKFRIPNALTLPLLLAGFLFNAWLNGAGGLLDSVVGSIVGFGIVFVLYVLGGMGAGDVKLVAAVGAWLGMPLTLFVFIAGSLAAGCYALILIVCYGRFRETLVNFRILWYRFAAFGRHLGAEDLVEMEVRRVDRRRRVIPFAAMLAVGLVAVLVWSWWRY